jgi:hypothetical protein
MYEDQCIRQFYRSEWGKNEDRYIRQFYRKDRVRMMIGIQDSSIEVRGVRMRISI